MSRHRPTGLFSSLRYMLHEGVDRVWEMWQLLFSREHRRGRRVMVAKGGGMPHPGFPTPLRNPHARLKRTAPAENIGPTEHDTRRFHAPALDRSDVAADSPIERPALAAETPPSGSGSVNPQLSAFRPQLSNNMDILRDRLDRKHHGSAANFVPPTVRQVKWLIWLYFWLLIFEGALRKWVVPALSDPLLIIRDPVVVLIYIQAIRGGFFPQHWLVKTTIALGVVTFFWGCAHLIGGSYKTLLVTIFGVRTYFLHLPLIFVMGYVFTRQDVLKIGKWVLLLSIPMAFLMAAQYKAGPTHFLNAATTGDDGQQLSAAMGRVRPPGTFSFISGPAAFFPVVAVFGIIGIMHPRLYPKWLIITAAVSSAFILPISGSRTLVLAVAIVVVFAVISLFFNPRYAPRFTIWAAVITFSGIAILTLPVGRQAIESFTARWDMAAQHEGHGEGASAAIANRMGGTFTEVFYYVHRVPFAGHGIGAGTNVGVKLLTGEVGFLYGEAEWTRNVMEAGPALGFTYIGFRIVFAFFLLFLALDRMMKGDPLGWLFMGATFLNIIIGQTSQSTSLGFLAFTSGLSLASVGVMHRLSGPSDNQRRFLRQKAMQREQLGQYQKPQSGPQPNKPDPDLVRPVPGGMLRPR